MQKPARSTLIGLGVGALLLGAIGLLPKPGAAEKWGPFRGRVVDIDTGEPIVGAAALVVWLEAVPTPVQTNQKFYDARIAVTDAEGVFEVPRREPPFFSFRIFKPYFDYLAPGYALANLVTNDERRVEMRKRTALSPEDLLRSSGTGIVDWVPREKLIEFTRAFNAERKRMGLRPIRSLRGE